MSSPADRQNNLDLVALMMLSRQLMLCVPSEGLPFQWHGSHSSIVLTNSTIEMTRNRTKNSAGPVLLKRGCVCATSGLHLCPAHLLSKLRGKHRSGALFSIKKAAFITMLRDLARQVGHLKLLSLKRMPSGDMAQDILYEGGSLATPMQAGGWTSSAYQLYLRSQQLQEIAVGQFLIEVSSSDEV